MARKKRANPTPVNNGISHRLAVGRRRESPFTGAGFMGINSGWL
jgi:hypothetical protein